MKHFRRIALLVAAIIAAALLGGCSMVENTAANKIDPNAQHPLATITMEDGRVMTAELYPEYAPNTVANFIELANSGFYDGIKFHRIVKDFVIQAGKASTAGREEVDYSIKGEFASNNFPQNTLKHELGVLSMARTNDKDSASSQFFIVIDNASHLDGEYAGFGKLTDDESKTVAYKLSRVAVTSTDVPVNDQTIKSIRVETYGQEYTVNKLK